MGKMQVTTLSLRVWAGQRDLVERAAKTMGMPVADYVRYRFIPIAARDAGVDPVPTFPPFGQPGRPAATSPEVLAAARRLGIPPQELITRAIQAGVDAALRVGTEPPPPPEPGIGERHWGNDDLLEPKQ